jgi:hypothetical protein
MACAVVGRLLRLSFGGWYTPPTQGGGLNRLLFLSNQSICFPSPPGRFARSLETSRRPPLPEWITPCPRSRHRLRHTTGRPPNGPASARSWPPGSVSPPPDQAPCTGLSSALFLRLRPRLHRSPESPALQPVSGSMVDRCCLAPWVVPRLVPPNRNRRLPAPLRRHGWRGNPPAPMGVSFGS